MNEFRLYDPKLAKKITEDGNKNMRKIIKAMKEKKQPQFIAFDSDNHDYVNCDTIEEAREYLEEGFLDKEEGYSQYTTDYKIYKLVETVELDTVAEKKDFNDEEWEEAGYSKHHDIICKHQFVPMDDVQFNITDYPMELYLELKKLSKKYNIQITTAIQKKKCEHIVNEPEAAKGNFICCLCKKPMDIK